MNLNEILQILATVHISYVNTVLRPPGIILPQSNNTQTLCNDVATYFDEKTQLIRMEIHTKLANDEYYSGCVIDSASQRLSKELN